MKRLMLKLCLLGVLAGVYAYAPGEPAVTCLGVLCPVCTPEQHRCGTCCPCNCTT
jgi:hypothetical protein